MTRLPTKQYLTAAAGQHGFTLIELSIAIVIVAIMSTGIVFSLVAQRTVSQHQENGRVLALVNEALLGFALQNGRLPCPDNISNGITGAEEINHTAPYLTVAGTGQETRYYQCQVLEGVLPYQALGISGLDGFGNLLRYRVNDIFSQSAETYTVPGGALLGQTGAFNLSTNGSSPKITVQDRNTADKSLRALNSDAAAVVISHGRNQAGAYTIDAVQLALPGGPDELANAADGANKYSRTPTPLPDGSCSDSSTALPFCEFDDQLTWIATSVLMNRMVAAGRLP